MTLPPPLTDLPDLDTQLQAVGYAVLDARALARLSDVPCGDFEAWAGCWDDLPPDGHLRDGGRYRRRRHSCFVVAPGSGPPGARLSIVPHRAHWQPVEYNALHGGIQRWFEPMATAMTTHTAWARLLVALADLAARLRHAPDARWCVEAHPFRIDTTDGIGRPTPEGAHRDGVDLVAVILVSRLNIKGGETRVFDTRGPQGVRFTLGEAWSALLLDDERVIHESTPIQPVNPSDASSHRDTLVLTFRKESFQGPADGM
ncbi:MAG: 2OG-Fe dioxygenase family protein [Ideonella sp.]|nr:2OG-Fe dioxygenase family protein [Ideonella sp.]